MNKFGSAIGALALLAVTTPALAQDAGLRPLRIGVVIPSRTGEIPIVSSVNDYVGEGALMGARLAEARLASEAEESGIHLDPLLANSPTAAAAERAARRLVEIEDVDALVGGIGEGQAEVLMQVAEDARIPFLNIGSTDDLLRGRDCSRYTFHVEASDAMYLDAMAALSVVEGNTRWFVVHPNDARGTALMRRAEQSLAKIAANGEIVGSAAVPAGLPSYHAEIAAAGNLGADAIVLLLDPMDQMVFLTQKEEENSDLPTLSFPHTLTQTRDYIAAARHVAPKANPRQRLALWETTLDEPYNDIFRSRWGEPTDPTAWSAYHAIKIILDAAKSSGDFEGEELVAALEGEVGFEVLKGPGTSFRKWDHQLRQPLYAVTVDREVVWERMSLPTRIAIAGNPAVLPPAVPGVDPVARLDLLGDTAETSACTF
ncbi:ABC transporter substrate-binding protein [Roseitranquillus sediminis]|uniref:ABC transporter substrate-binding protein n=1 Tax=Roseitranquillus sediminis TaxID=2809051 RepID=UPI001D0C3761|nr:ABC transporter substrate-binding protein [Roseitranquillus sediminis]MBM9595466.1 ABC transporter substrate-binding protein [Roseitranquillus sediminis]